MHPRDIFDYEPSTGILTFKHRGREYFDTERGYKIFCGQYAGKIAGHRSSNGYVQVNFNGRKRNAHIIAWWIFYGEKPEGIIDHIDGDGLNNRIDNLRIVSKSGNAKNSRRSISNTSGVTGVSRSKNGNGWRAYITSNGLTKRLGVYANFDDAVKARKEAEKEYGFHKNHGR